MTPRTPLLAGADAALSAGVLQNHGWTMLNFGVLPILAFALLMILRRVFTHSDAATT